MVLICISQLLMMFITIHVSSLKFLLDLLSIKKLGCLLSCVLYMYNTHTHTHLYIYRERPSEIQFLHVFSVFSVVKFLMSLICQFLNICCSTICSKGHPLPTELPLYFFKNELPVYVWAHLLDCLIYYSTCFQPVPHCLNYCIISLKSK